MRDKVIDNYPHVLTFLRNCYKTHKMYDKAVNTQPSTIQLVPECYKTHEMYDKAVNRSFLYLVLFLICIKLK